MEKKFTQKVQNFILKFCIVIFKVRLVLFTFVKLFQSVIGEKELVEFLTEEILAERKAQKVKTIPTEIEGFKASLNGAEVTLTKKTDNET